MARVLVLAFAIALLVIVGPGWGALAVYYVLVMPLLHHVVRDMARRGRKGWPYIAWLLCSPVLGLLAYWVDRRRFPVLQPLVA